MICDKRCTFNELNCPNAGEGMSSELSLNLAIAPTVFVIVAQTNKSSSIT
jgi:hypothetical protein